MINENTRPSTKIYFLDEQKNENKKKTVQPQPFKKIPGTRFELARAKLTWT